MTAARRALLSLSLPALLSIAVTRAAAPAKSSAPDAPRPRARDAGVVIGILPPGPLNAITDVAGVRVGHATLVRGDSVRTGVTAVLPHAGNLFQEKVPAAIFVGNGFGKLMGSTQVEELGEIETPILLTGTLNVPRVADALIDWVLALPGNDKVLSINPIVAETNDGYLNDIRGRHVGRAEVIEALRAARDGPVPEGSVGAGTGTVAFGFKGGIGTSSRALPRGAGGAGGYTVGVLVQSNFGGILSINGAPVGRALGRYFMKEIVEPPGEQSRGADAPGAAPPGSAPGETPRDRADGSIIVVVATDAPLDVRNLKRLAARAMLGLARTGSPSTNGSGDYVIAFSTAAGVRIRSGEAERRTAGLSNEAMSPLFLAVAEATEEAIINSLFRATTVTGIDGHTAEALPIDRTLEILRRHGALAGSDAGARGGGPPAGESP
jgi:D-aminopeptidase